MFAPHTAKINIRRCEPRSDGGLEKVILRNRRISEKVVTGNLLRSKPKAPAKSLKKIMQAWETDERLKKLKPFVEYWNKWGVYYRELGGEWCPKNRGQITCMENTIELADKEDIHLDTFIGCTWKAYEKKKHIPSVQLCLSLGLEFVDRFIDDLRFDLDQEEYWDRHG